MRYLHSDPRSSAGPLIPMRRAPECVICGRAIWIPIWKSDEWPQTNAKGERLGYVPNHRSWPDKEPRCWNGKACAKREAGDHEEG